MTMTQHPSKTEEPPVRAAAASAGPRPMSGAVDSILQTIGDTPLVRLHRVTAGVRPDVLAKVEFFNPGGSVKDRIGLSIIEDAEREGRLKPGGTIVESTSGNTGVGLAIVAALRGYRTVFVMPDKMSEEKIRFLRAFGARVVITPTAVEPDDPRSYYNVAKRIVEETPGAVLANQYHNPANPESHYRSTGPELWAQTDGRITHFICGLGTGGTISGTGRYLKEQNPDIQIVGVDPEGSILYDYFYSGETVEAHTYKVEGIGEDFVPSTTDFSYVDDVVQVNDRESFLMTRRLVREEGIFSGGSCGSAVAGALRYIRQNELGPEAVVVVLLPDSGNRYLSKIFDDEWMRENGYLDNTVLGGSVADLVAALGERPLFTVAPTARMSEVVSLLKAQDISQVPVVDGDRVVGVVSERELLGHMLEAEHEHSPDETIEPLVTERVVVVDPDTALADLGRLFADGNPLAVVRDDGQLTTALTKIDLIDYLSGRHDA